MIGFTFVVVFFFLQFVALQINALAAVPSKPVVDYKIVKTPHKVPGGTFLDEEAMLAQSTFPIKPDDLVARAKEVLGKGAGVDDPDLLADDFEFCAPVVGPIGKKQYLDALNGFKLLDAFPDMENNFHFVRVDPFEHNRVWWHSRAVATQTGEFMGKKPTNKKLYLPPQANSFVFNEQGKVKEITVGYVLDRRIGNTGGLGGAFAYMYGIGAPLPIPECQPYRRSLRFRALNAFGSLMQKLNRKKE